MKSRRLKGISLIITVLCLIMALTAGAAQMDTSRVSPLWSSLFSERAST